MTQTIKLYQAVRYASGVNSSPIFATEKTWLGRGFYFWEHEIENAHYWGKKHYNDQYCIYQSSYQNTEGGLDLVDNYEHRDLLIKYIEQIKGRVKENISLAQIITLIRKKTPKRIHYIRIETGSFFPKDRIQLPVLSKGSLPYLHTKRLVQVCFPEFPCQEIRLTDYKKHEDRSIPILG